MVFTKLASDRSDVLSALKMTIVLASCPMHYIQVIIEKNSKSPRFKSIDCGDG